MSVVALDRTVAGDRHDAAAGSADTAGPVTWRPRPAVGSWWQTRQHRDELTERLLALFTVPGEGRTRDKTRRRGLTGAARLAGTPARGHLAGPVAGPLAAAGGARSASARRRAGVSDVPAGADPDLLDLSTLGARRDLQPHRATLVPRLPATPGPVHRLRPRQVDPRRDHRRTAVRDVHPTRPVRSSTAARAAANPPSCVPGGAPAARSGNACTNCCARTPARSTHNYGRCTTTWPTTNDPRPCWPG